MFVVLFKWNSTLLALPESNLLIFKVADVKPYCLLGSSGFQSQMIRGFILPCGFLMPAVSGGGSAPHPTLCLLCPSCRYPMVVFVSHLHLCSSYPLQCVLFTIFSYILPVFKLYSGLFTLMWALPNCVSGNSMIF